MTSESDGSRQKRPGRTLHVQELNVDKGSERVCNALDNAQKDKMK